MWHRLADKVFGDRVCDGISRFSLKSNSVLSTLRVIVILRGRNSKDILL